MDGHLRIDDLVDATRQLVTVESPTDDLTACEEVVEATHELSRACCPSQAVSRGTVADLSGAGDRRALGYFFSGIWTRCGRWEPWSESRSRWTGIE